MSQSLTHLQPYISQGDEHQWLAYLGGGELGVILDAAITGGQLTVIDAHPHRGDASPVHIHTRDDEAFLLLDGRMTVWVGDQRWQLQPGGVVFLPRNIPHAVRYDIASRALVVSVPGRFQESILRSAGWDQRKPRPAGWHIPPEVLRQAAQENGVTLIGQPHGLAD